MDMQSRSNENIPCLKRQIAEVKKATDNIMKAIEQGIFTGTTKARLEELEVALLKEEMKSIALTEEQVLFWLRRYRKMNTDGPRQRQQLIDDFINSVILFDDYILLTFNYREGTIKVPFSLISGSDTSGYSPP